MFPWKKERIGIFGKHGAFSTAKTIYIMKWTIDGKQYMNHYLSGYPTFDPDWYIELMKKAEIL